jgi:hypothetical protein
LRLKSGGSVSRTVLSASGWTGLVLHTAPSASVVSSYVRSVILMDERSLYFQMRQDSDERSSSIDGGVNFIIDDLQIADFPQKISFFRLTSR